MLNLRTLTTRRSPFNAATDFAHTPAATVHRPTRAPYDAQPIRLWPLGEDAGGLFEASMAALAARLRCGRDNGD